MNPTFSHLVTRFFSSFLVNERGLSPNTIASYSDCMRLLINYACEQFNVQPEKLTFEHFNRDVILDFLDDLERNRNNSASTRNQRLAVIKTFFHFVARIVPEMMALNTLIQAIGRKKTEQSPPPSLAVSECDAIIDSADTTTLLGIRDKAMLQFAYNTGARVQEMADLHVSDVHLDTPATVTLTGKGNKTRVVPIWPETASLISDYLEARDRAGTHHEHLFLSNRAQPLTRFGIAKIVGRHTDSAAGRCPSLQGRRITPHVFRHTVALGLIEAGNDITVVQEWLGHADLKTTSHYVEISVQRKRRALEKFPSPADGTTTQKPKWKKPGLLSFLSALSKTPRYVPSENINSPHLVRSPVPDGT